MPAISTPKNPAKEFLKRVKRFKDFTQTLRERDPMTNIYWPFMNNYEANLEDCFKREDGLWEKKEKINTHCKNGGYRVVFIWRIHPNYCVHGKPCFTADHKAEFLEKSETEKILLEFKNFQFVWKWHDIVMPTNNIWGMSMGKPYFELRNEGEVLARTSVKKHFVEVCSEYLGG